MLQIKYKVLAHAKDLPRPAYQTKGSSGLDLYAANIDSIQIKSLQRLSISTGIVFSIPKGVDDGTRIRLAGKGEAGTRGASNGDLYIFVNVEVFWPT